MAARNLAFSVLMKVERSDAYLNIALDSALRSAKTLSRQDSALTTELCYGVTRRKLTLDHALAAFSSRPLKKIETAVLVALRIGAYQLLFLERIPDHAAVGEIVQLVKEQGWERAAGLVNAILRKIAANRRFPLPEDPYERLAVEESHPLWLVDRWWKRFGEQGARELCHANNQAASVCVRVSLRYARDEVLARLADEGVRAQPTSFSPLGLQLENPGPIYRLKAFAQGLFQVQDEAAQLVSWSAARPGMQVLDACAAPGAKTCHLAEQLQSNGKVVAVDIHPRKLEKIQAEAKRLKIESSIQVLAADSTGRLPFADGHFDMVLLDAPCSGLGTLRRHPELRYRRQEADIGRLADFQYSLAANVEKYLKPGGVLIYSVCSTEPEEGPQIAEKLVHDLRYERVAITVPGAEALCDSLGAMVSFPHYHHTDGFYSARLRKP